MFQQTGRFMLALLVTATLVPSFVNTAYALPAITVNQIGPALVPDMQDADIIYVTYNPIAPNPGVPPVVSLEASVTSGYTLNVDAPSGAIVAGSEAFKRVTWNLQSLPSDYASGVTDSAAFGITFSAGAPSSAEYTEKNVLLVVEKTLPAVEVKLDKTVYQNGETAYITVTDVHAHKNDKATETITAQASTNLNPNSFPIELTNSIDNPSEFTGTYPFQNISYLEVTYGAQSARADRGLYISFSRDHYYQNEIATLTLHDPNAVLDGAAPGAVIPEVKVSGIPVVGLAWQEVAPGQFEAQVTAAGDVLTATYKNTPAKALVIPSTFRFDKDQYHINDLVSIKLTDRDANTNPNARDSIVVQLNSMSTGDMREIQLVETGKNTAIFATPEKVLLADNANANTQYPSRITLRTTVGDQIYATFNGRTMDTVPGVPAGASIASLPATVPVPPGPPGTPGYQGSPNAATPVFTDIAIVDCTAYNGDQDHDGACDKWEYPASGGYLKIPYNGATYTFTHVCDPRCPDSRHKDVFVEIDYLTGRAPSSTALANVKTAFDRAPILNNDGTLGIRLHQKVSQDVGSFANTIVWSSTNNNAYTTIKSVKLGITSSQNSGDIQKAWAQVAHYFLWTNYQQFDTGVSGIAEIVGNDAIVSLGSFTNSVDQQQGTYMHELGHNLGLDHGGGLAGYPTGQPSTYNWYGDHSVNCKPNYPSVMSHPRQFTNSFTGNTLDYSRGAIQFGSSSYITNDLRNLQESIQVSGSATMLYGVNGVPYTVSIPINQIDWNQNGSFGVGNPPTPNNLHQLNIHNCSLDNPPPADYKLWDHNDWGTSNDSSNLVLDFRFWNNAAISTGAKLQDTVAGETLTDVRDTRSLSIVQLANAIQATNSSYFDGGTATRTAYYSQLVVNTGNVKSLVQNDKLEDAVAKLKDIRTHMDGSKGGNPKDDDLSAAGQGPVLRILDNNLAALKVELDVPYKKTNPIFNMTHYVDDKTTYTIVGNGTTIAPTVNTFEIDDVNRQLHLDLIGQGDVILDIPAAIFHSTIQNVTTSGDGTFQPLPSGDSSTIRVELKDLPYYPRTQAGAAVALQFGPPRDVMSVAPPDLVGPDFKTVVVTISDSDLDINSNLRESVAGRVVVASDRGTASRADLTVDETGLHTGLFIGRIQLNPSSTPGSSNSGSDKVTINVLPGDHVSVRYSDVGPSGSSITISKVIQVVSVDPVITTNKSSYTSGETMTITIRDLDANRDSDTIRTWMLRITSTSDAVGLDVPAIETGPNTGVFIATVPLSSTVSSGSLQVTTGDTVAIRYVDEFPANYTTIPTSKEFVITRAIGIPSPIDITQAEAKDASGNSVIMVTAGQQVILSSTITNNNSSLQPFAAIVEVRDADGFTVYLQWQTGTVAANGTVNIGLSWTPDAPGEYTVRTFALTSISNPGVLSPVAESTITVS